MQSGEDYILHYNMLKKCTAVILALTFVGFATASHSHSDLFRSSNNQVAHRHGKIEKLHHVSVIDSKGMIENKIKPHRKSEESLDRHHRHHHRRHRHHRRHHRPHRRIRHFEYEQTKRFSWDDVRVEPYNENKKTNEWVDEEKEPCDGCGDGGLPPDYVNVKPDKNDGPDTPDDDKDDPDTPDDDKDDDPDTPDDDKDDGPDVDKQIKPSDEKKVPEEPK